MLVSMVLDRLHETAWVRRCVPGGRSPPDSRRFKLSKNGERFLATDTVFIAVL